MAMESLPMSAVAIDIMVRRQERKGLLSYAWGGRYEGDWKANKMHGKGFRQYVNGDRYEGDWKDDKKDGVVSATTFTSGNHYVGDWKDDRYEGDSKDGEIYVKGVFNFSYGNCYEGGYKDNKRDGDGVFTYPNGRRQED